MSVDLLTNPLHHQSPEDQESSPSSSFSNFLPSSDMAIVATTGVDYDCDYAHHLYLDTDIPNDPLNYTRESHKNKVTELKGAVGIEEITEEVLSTIQIAQQKPDKEDSLLSSSNNVNMNINKIISFALPVVSISVETGGNGNNDKGSREHKSDFMWFVIILLFVQLIFSSFHIVVHMAVSNATVPATPTTMVLFRFMFSLPFGYMLAYHFEEKRKGKNLGKNISLPSFTKVNSSLSEKEGEGLIIEIPSTNENIQKICEQEFKIRKFCMHVVL